MLKVSTADRQNVSTLNDKQLYNAITKYLPATAQKTVRNNLFM